MNRLTADLIELCLWGVVWLFAGAVLLAIAPGLMHTLAGVVTDTALFLISVPLWALDQLRELVR